MKRGSSGNLLFRQGRAHSLRIEKEEQGQKVERSVASGVVGKVVVDESRHVGLIRLIEHEISVSSPERTDEAAHISDRIDLVCLFEFFEKHHEGSEIAQNGVDFVIRDLDVQVQSEGVNNGGPCSLSFFP